MMFVPQVWGILSYLDFQRITGLSNMKGKKTLVKVATLGGLNW